MKKRYWMTVCACAAAMMVGGCGQKAAAEGTKETVIESQSEEESQSLEETKEESKQAVSESESETETTAEETTETAETALMTETAETEAAAETTQAAAVEASVKSVQDIYSQITGSVALISPVTMQDAFISNYYGIDPAGLSEYVFEMSEDATSAETVVILKAKNEADTASLASALQVLVDEKKAEMETYLPEQFQIVNRSAVKTNGAYVYLVISENQDAILRIIEAGL